mgnify:CR=1 FL=1
MKNVKVTVEIPANVDRLIRGLCALDGTDREAWYQDLLLDGLTGFLNSAEFIDWKGVARKFQLNKSLPSLDRTMFGEV